MMKKNNTTKVNYKYHCKRKVIKFKKNLDADKKFFWIHNGAGRLEAYFLLSELIRNDFDVYGVALSTEIGFVPKKITIQNIAKKYIEEIKRLQPRGPYYIAGWCLGGNIAFEMAAQLEQAGEEIGFCGLFNTHPPKYFSQIHPKDFSMESEIDYVCKFITNGKLREKLINCNEVHQFWDIIKNELKDDDFNKELFIEMDNWGLTHNIPNVEKASLYDMFYGINIIRTLHDARVFYTPEYKLKSSVYMFNAKKEPIERISDWNKYCYNLSICEVEGDHFSMFDERNVDLLSIKLNQLL
ncbi:thioesterase domain-containing protein [Paramaledivibacter caminithermalis]|jgi:thioesterase domain-containing protein|uniref:Thioesterase domain-containing protein n=1 Tax=Paramaledivibacter caminithermalis (strain DSM 15212 / CIP 107654 / DViRD3) TaxID=1121301 RepID=A0A1M6QRG0_PARC5|nr:thioesterase domain-containing protein [Paramaledivibacter caminithermalis]SHK22872.1 Thioesterase domain-containing protein [Paramaledivibacter caminithermalis DSM 15212]